MASSIVTSAAKQLGSLVVEEVKSLYEVSDKIERLQRNLLWMRCFLEDADNIQHQEKVVGMWVSEMRDFAYEAQEIIERYLHHVSHPRRNGAWNAVKWFSCSFCDARALHAAGSEIDDLRRRIGELISSLQLYGVKMNKRRGSSEYDLAMREQRRTYSHTKQDPIGLENHVKEVVDTLVANNNGVKVVGICGIGGLGKTTLARQVFLNTTVKEHFKNHCVWVYISKQFERRTVFEEILIGLGSFTEGEDGRKRIKRLTDDELPTKICEALNDNACLVVLDDMWNHGDWDLLKYAFESNEHSNSKILITTRNKSLVKHADPNGYSHEFGILNDEDSWKLLKRTLNLEGGSPVAASEVEEKEKLAKDMLKHCDGLPLGILALGGLLVNKNTIYEWKIVQKNISHYLMNNMEQGSDESRGLGAVLELSYYGLPYYLKPCFMYLGMFPEDHEIEVERLFHLWEAEGLVTSALDGGDEIAEVSLDDIVEVHLNQLVERSMLQVEKSWPNGRIMSCQLHDVMRDMCLKKCREVNFLSVIEVGDSQHSSNDHTGRAFAVNRGMRRCALTLRDLKLGPNLRNSTPCIRSLVVFSQITDDLRQAKLLSGRKFFSLLRVLDLAGVPLPMIPWALGDFIHLRLLRLSEDIFDLPPRFWDCKYLETLDLEGCWITSLSNKFRKLERLRHLYLPTHIYKLEGSPKLILTSNQLAQMETLETLIRGYAGVRICWQCHS